MTYTEVEKLHDLCSQFCVESAPTLHELNLKKEQFENEINKLEEEIQPLEDLKDQFPYILFKIEQLRQIKIQGIKNLESFIRAINELIGYINN